MSAHASRTRPRLTRTVRVLLLLAAAATGTADRCDDGQLTFPYAKLIPPREFSCCTPDVCNKTTPAPCCAGLSGRLANDPAVCAALGELFTNDWGMNAAFPCFGGWGWSVDSNNEVDYSNGEVPADIASALLDRFTDTGADAEHSRLWPPSGWTAAALGVHADYCTFYGVSCVEGIVISM